MTVAWGGHSGFGPVSQQAPSLGSHNPGSSHLTVPGNSQAWASVAPNKHPSQPTVSAPTAPTVQIEKQDPLCTPFTLRTQLAQTTVRKGDFSRLIFKILNLGLCLSGDRWNLAVMTYFQII